MLESEIFQPKDADEDMLVIFPIDLIENFINANEICKFKVQFLNKNF